MRAYKNIQFCEGIVCTLTEFKKTFAPHLKKLSESEVKEAHKVAIKGNKKKSETDELSGSSGNGKEADTSKNKQ